jgi:RNA polymerase sigma factor (sigma-70 family)
MVVRGMPCHSSPSGRPDGEIHAVGPAGSAAAEQLFATLYRDYHRPLLAFVLRLTGGDRQHAEDVVQETMVRAWRSVDTLSPQSESVMPWLATVARRIVIDQWRRRDSRPPEVGETALDALTSPDQTDGILHSVAVADAMRALTPAHRDVLTATVLQDRTVNQAARVLDVPVGTVKSRVYYALRALRVVLEERGITA